MDEPETANGEIKNLIMALTQKVGGFEKISSETNKETKKKH